MPDPIYRLELPVGEAAYAFTGRVDDDTGKVLLDIAVRVDDQTGPVPVGSLTIPSEHLSGLARTLPQVLRSLAQTHRPRRRSLAARRSYQARLAATKAAHPRAYEQWDEDEEQRLRATFNPNAANLAGHLDELAATFQRQPSAIRSRLVRLGLLSN